MSQASGKDDDRPTNRPTYRPTDRPTEPTDRLPMDRPKSHMGRLIIVLFVVVGAVWMFAGLYDCLLALMCLHCVFVVFACYSVMWYGVMWYCVL